MRVLDLMPISGHSPWPTIDPLLAHLVRFRLVASQFSRAKKVDTNAVNQKPTHVHHHYVPRFFLKAWAGDDKKLGVFKRIATGALLYDRLSPKSVANEEHLYSIEGWSDLPDVFIEKEILAPLVDDLAAPVHQHILKRGVGDLSEDQRVDWARLLVAGIWRIPGHLELIREIGVQQFVRSNPGHGLTDAQLKSEGLKRFVLEIGSHSTNNRILRANWWLVKVPPGWKDALTGDMPFVLLGNLYRDNFALIVPISPQYFFVCSAGQDYVDKTLHMRPTWMTKATNTRVVQYASEYVYATDERHRGLVEKWLRRPMAKT